MTHEVEVEGHGEPKIRPATPRDAVAMADLWLRSRRASVEAIPAPVHSDDEVRAFFADVVASEQELWVVDGDDGDDAMAALLVLDEGWVDQLYVGPSRTGAGLGSRLVGVAKDRCPDGLDLWTFAANAGARRFYERHGFVVVTTTDGDNEEGAPDVHYHWPAT